jgi:hypothetical protein
MIEEKNINYVVNHIIKIGNIKPILVELGIYKVIRNNIKRFVSDLSNDIIIEILNRKKLKPENILLWYSYWHNKNSVDNQITRLLWSYLMISKSNRPNKLADFYIDYKVIEYLAEEYGLSEHYLKLKEKLIKKLKKL